MFKFRSLIVATLVLSSLICVMWAKPKPLNPKQQQQKQACDNSFNSCFSGCGTTHTGSGSDSTTDCQNRCISQLAACYQRIGIEAPPRAHLPLHVPTAQLSSSPTATPKTTQRQPTGVLQSSPTPTPKKTATPTPSRKKN